jgi:hypothetical protein
MDLMQNPPPSSFLSFVLRDNNFLDNINLRIRLGKTKKAIILAIKLSKFKLE